MSGSSGTVTIPHSKDVEKEWLLETGEDKMVERAFPKGPMTLD